MKNKDVWKHIGNVSVDSGQIVVMDPGYLTKDMIVDDPGLDYENQDDFYSKCCAASLNECCGKEFNILGQATAVAVESGYGDGIYPVFAKYKNGRISELKIVFI